MHGNNTVCITNKRWVGYILSRARSGRARCILIVSWSALCLCPAHPSLKLQSGISAVLCQTFIFYLFPVQQTTIGIGYHPVKSFFRAGNQYVECEKQQQEQTTIALIGYHRKAGGSRVVFHALQHRHPNRVRTRRVPQARLETRVLGRRVRRDIKTSLDMIML